VHNILPFTLENMHIMKNNCGLKYKSSSQLSSVVIQILP